jgi:hypothetical protein
LPFSATAGPEPRSPPCPFYQNARRFPEVGGGLGTVQPKCSL